MSGVADSYLTRDPARVSAIAREHGFCLIKEFFTPARIAALERTLLAVPAADRACDFLTLGVFNDLLFEPRLLAIARDLLGKELVYYGETNCMIDNAKPFREWHFDARGMPEKLSAAFDSATGEIYPAWRFAVYFRDYSAASGGLKVGPGSHVHPIADFKKPAIQQEVAVRGRTLRLPMPAYPLYNVPTTPGDLVIFNLRTFHSAGALRLDGAMDVALLPIMEEALLTQAPEIAVAEPVAARNAMMLDFAAPAATMDLYPKWRVRELLRREQPAAWQDKIRETPWGPSAYDRPDIGAPAQQHGVTLRYDRIIGQLIWKKRNAADRFSDADQGRLDHLLAINPEYSPYYPLRDFAA